MDSLLQFKYFDFNLIRETSNKQIQQETKIWKKRKFRNDAAYTVLFDVRMVWVKTTYDLSRDHVFLLKLVYGYAYANISREDFHINNIISLNIRMHNYFLRNALLYDDVANVWTVSKNPGFIIKKKGWLSDDVANHFNGTNGSLKIMFMRKQVMSTSEILTYISDGIILVLNAEMDTEPRIETYANFDSDYINIHTIYSNIAPTGNVLRHLYTLMPTELNMMTPMYKNLVKRVSGLVTDAQIEVSEDVQLHIFDKYVVCEVVLKQKDLCSSAKVVANVRIDMDEFRVNNVSDLKFLCGGASFDDPSVSPNISNLIFQSDIYGVINKLVFENDVQFTCEIKILSEFIGFDERQFQSIESKFSEAMNTDWSVITVVGTKGSGKSKFLEKVKEEYQGLFCIDSDAYGVYLGFLCEMAGIVNYGEMFSKLEDFDLTINGAAFNAMMELEGEYDEAFNLPVVYYAELLHDHGDDMPYINHEFSVWVAKVYQNRVLGCSRFLSTAMVYLSTNIDYVDYHNVLYFAHTSLETCFITTALILNVVPCFSEHVVLTKRKRVNKAIVNLGVDTVKLELALYYFYYGYINKDNATGWLTVNRVFGFEVKVDLTDYAIGKVYNYMFEYSDDEIIDNYVCSLPRYMVAFPLMEFNLQPFMANMLILPIGHGKSFLSEKHPSLFIQIDEAFTGTELVELYSSFDSGNFLYLYKYMNVVFNHAKQGDYADKIVLVQNIEIALAANFPPKIFRLNYDKLPIEVIKYNIDSVREANMTFSLNHLEKTMFDSGVSATSNFFDSLEELQSAVLALSY